MAVWKKIPKFVDIKLKDMSYLNFNEIGQRCPSALTQEPSNHLSNIYRFIPTTEVIDLLGEQGWLPTQAMQTRSRKGHESKMPFKKHMLRFRNNTQNELLPRFWGDCAADDVLVDI